MAITELQTVNGFGLTIFAYMRIQKILYKGLDMGAYLEAHKIFLNTCIKLLLIT